MQVLTQLESILLISSSIKLLTLRLLDTIFHRALPNSSQKSSINSTVLKMYKTLITDKNPLIRQKTLESFLNFLDVTKPENPSKYTEYLSGFHETFADYFKQSESDLKVDDKYLSLMKSLKYNHRCLEWSSIVVPQQKKFKSNNDQAEVHFRKIQEHVNYLKCFFSEQKVDEKYVGEVKQMISELQSLI